ncbi:DNA gyrase subunit A [Fusobacterium perfoetens]|uniref:DNA gyrase subunit A n=1 Tax=Fusobacterium perfoetens TaxID=852 RepID=UPI00048784B4|nr:DNA gyrase subunit A [Fusobacterium perfoetens]MCI6151584.1 DNA gyrase subunit A [Fusobacterium perfoetens]MDY3237752.1 DNA gyrase subunit A [Fusobacterium perfoetens]
MSNIIDRYVEEEMKQCYLDYSMSVIVSRAIPDVRDGLKPVHRRILYAMNELGMTHDKPFKKCARIVGEVLGKYHPHGDSAVYGAMVRMAQDFNYRYELVDGHGNFGSIDGDGAAAMRYTEARMAKISDEILADIDKDTIDFRKNFDDSLDEPVVLPAKIPNLLLNGTVGIAVGMATNIPPHNLGELVDGTLALIDNRDITPLELVDYIPGPDFPTGGIINGKKGIIDAYTKGRGKIQLRAKIKIEDASNGKQAIIVNEIPYQINKSALIERIALLVKEKKLTGISDLRDESDRDGIRIVIELKKGEEPEIVLNKLYKYTELQTSFGVIMLALVNNVPKVLNLKEVLEEYVKHRFEIITRRTKFELDKAEKRDHILQGFRIALENIDRIIELIKNSSDGNTAKEALMTKYAFTDIQARSIMDMKLQRLTGLEREKIEQEFQELERKIKEYKEILADEQKIYDIMKQELIEIKEKYNDDRRTLIEDERKDIDVEDLIKDEKVLLTITNKGYVKRIGIANYKAQKRGGRGVSSQNTIEDDFVEDMFVMNNLDTVMIFTDKGRVYRMKAYEVPETSKQSRGKLISNIINFQEDEKPAFIIKVREFSDKKEVIFVTKDGTIKKTNLMEYANINSNGKIAINFREGDALVFAGLIKKETDQLFIATKLGYSIRMDLNEVRSISRSAIGVKGINLREGDNVVSALLITDPENETILTVTSNGFGKRSRVMEYTTQNRGGKGIINFKLTSKTGEIIGVKPVKEDEEIMAINSSGVVIRTSVESIAVHGRATSGVKIMKTDEDTRVVAVVKVKSEKDEERIISEDEQENLEDVKNKLEEIKSEDNLFKTFDNEDEEM